MALAVGVKKLALFHHDPKRTDDQVDEIVQVCRNRVKAANGNLEVFAAADNTSHTLQASGSKSQRQSSVSESLKPRLLPETKNANKECITNSALIEGRLTSQEIVVSHPRKEAFDGLEEDGVQAVFMDNDLSFAENVQKRKPSLIVMRHSGEEGKDDDGEEMMIRTCKRIRRDGGEWGSEVPYLVTVPDQTLLDTIKERGNKAGVTDWIVEPFKQSYIRTRIRMGIARKPCRWVLPAILPNEKERLGALHNLKILDSSPEERFDRITRLAAKMFDVPIVLVSLVDANRQWFKSTQWTCAIPGGGSTPPPETGRDISFCGHAIHEEDMLLIPDATQDDRFADNPLVADEDGLKIRFYCGRPLRVPAALAGGMSKMQQGSTDTPKLSIGTLCLIDKRPRDMDERQKALLRELGAMVEHELLAISQKMDVEKLTSINTLIVEKPGPDTGKLPNPAEVA